MLLEHTGTLRPANRPHRAQHTVVNSALDCASRVFEYGKGAAVCISAGCSDILNQHAKPLDLPDMRISRAGTVAMIGKTVFVHTLRREPWRSTNSTQLLREAFKTLRKSQHIIRSYKKKNSALSKS